jgi:hypothetical protein
MSVEGLPLPSVPVSSPLRQPAPSEPGKQIKKNLPSPSPSEITTQEQTRNTIQKIVSDTASRISRTTVQLDQHFVCDEKTYNQSLKLLNNLQKRAEDFDTAAFIRGEKGQKSDPHHVIQQNTAILNDMKEQLRAKAEDLVNKDEAQDLLAAYKKLVGIIDRYDDMVTNRQFKEQGTSPISTYALRTALLKASHADGTGLETWCVYTKSGKPESAALWPFLENIKNWLPEAQGARAKWVESTRVKTTALSQSQQEKNVVVLLKGGFGAGKTRFITEKFGEHAVGAVAPDKAKEIDRRASPDLPHSAAHIHGSQAAYELMNELIQKQEGTFVYDSSLGNPKDVEKYLESCKSSGKKMVVYDVARNDMARALSVLKRSVEGEDPRIPPDFIIRSAINDKMNRVKCMEVVLNDTTSETEMQPEYHFIGGDKQGWNTREVMVLGSNGKIELQPDAKERLALEGIEVLETDKTLRLTLDKASLEKFYNEQFERPVKEIIKELSSEEQASLVVFRQRVFPIALREGKIENPTALYLALPEKIREAIPQKAFESAFESVGTEVRNAFFASIQSKEQFSYEDLPLKVALIIHQNVKTDPWKT